MLIGGTAIIRNVENHLQIPEETNFHSLTPYIAYASSQSHLSLRVSLAYVHMGAPSLSPHVSN